MIWKPIKGFFYEYEGNKRICKYNLDMVGWMNDRLDS